MPSSTEQTDAGEIHEKEAKKRQGADSRPPRHGGRRAAPLARGPCGGIASPWGSVDRRASRRHPSGRQPAPAAKRDARRARLPEGYVTLHSLRHRHASHMLASNIHPKVVQKRLGHSSIAITMDLSHLMPNMQGEAAPAVDGVLRAAINKRADDVG
ncbi:tyrosine-type recombinase/integrase [Bradyrhizobium sp. BEA-2-5]|uniref:tyrosine-type recombinase/integrase n=2 Tax=Nitrobacteraceae TaxID=41294 RepID=UPI001FCCC74D|nr:MULTISPECIES: tyrosine-type recombinase/integrase [Bradyrhizobium]WOH85329.1 tyrosine-type recombinase/integrase [Bradyrhizobium sp. BEA-2-5]